MRVRTVAPAKINWTLEVLGRRPDGYHEIRSVMQTIDLCDEVEVQTKEEGIGREGKSEPAASAGGASLAVEGIHEAAEDDLALRAVRAFEEATGRKLPAEIRLVKPIRVAAGLGGGSSDATAVLRGLATLYRLDVPDADISAIAARIGSDVPFFLTGGTALAEGRGELITPLPDVLETWLVVVAPPIWMEEKTKRMYGALTPEDFSDGRRTQALAERLGRGERVRGEDLCNAFERAAYESFKGLAACRDRFLEAGAGKVHLAGAGPSLFAVFDSRGEADGVVGRLQGSEGQVIVARALGAEEAVRVEL